MTATDTDTDLDGLEDLDFDVPCEVKQGGVRCDQSAEWMVTFRPHCPENTVRPWLICQRHLDLVVHRNTRAVCSACKVTANLSDYIVSITPLNRTGATS